MSRVTANGQMIRARTSIHEQSRPYELRVMRRVAPGQPKLSKVIAALSETTGNFVNYKKDPRRLGVTLMMLGPLMRHLLGTGPGQRVTAEDLRTAEEDLNRRVAHAKYQDYNVPLFDPMFQPLDLYGHKKQYLGIRLSPKDLRLTGDRAIVESYFRGKFRLSENDLDRHLEDLDPHITIGRVLYGNMDEEQIAALQDNPSTFLLQADRARQERLVEFEGRPAVVPIVFPEAIGLNGLRIVCQPKGS